MSHNVKIVELTHDLLDERFLDTLSHLSSVDLDVPTAHKILRIRKEEGARTYVAIVDGEIHGSASLVIETKFLHAGGKVGHVEDVVVHGVSRGLGIGRKLVEHATREAKIAGCYKCILACTPSNKPFYEKCGYREHEIEMRCDL